MSYRSQEDYGLVFEMYLPLVNCFGVDLESPNESGEEFNAPWIPEDVLHVCNVHTKLVAESSLHFKWDLSKISVHA